MNRKFAVFILTHGRAENVITVNALKKGGYTGKVYFIIDDEDEQADLYRQKFGNENVIQFCKQDVYNETDTMDILNQHKAIVYARNVSWKIAESLGLTHFLMLDDDYSSFDYRYIDGESLRAKPVRCLDKIFAEMLDFLDKSNALTVAFAQGGDFIGGADGGNFKKGLLRKAMNTFFCRTDRIIKFRGTMNEDVVTYTTLSSRGNVFFSFTHIMIVQEPTQSLSGGMSDVYKDGGTYLKSFYAVMSMPSSVKIDVMHSKYERVHHNIDWDRTAPKILHEKWKKGATR